MYPRPVHISEYPIKVATLSGNSVISIDRDDPQLAASPIPPMSLNEKNQSSSIIFSEVCLNLF